MGLQLHLLPASVVTEHSPLTPIHSYLKTHQSYWIKGPSIRGLEGLRREYGGTEISLGYIS